MSEASVPVGEREGLEAPVAENERIQSLDVLRGFGLFGILLLNILGFGLLSAYYSNPGLDVSRTFNLTFFTWATIELTGEGIMRCLFSMLFGAGVILFTAGRDHAFSLHYKRTFWLLMFGILNAYIFLWNGDILITYAIAGAILYWFRNLSAKGLFVAAVIATTLSTGIMMTYGWSLYEGREAYEKAMTLGPDEEMDAFSLELAKGWEDFLRDYVPSEEQKQQELDVRTSSYASALKWNTHHKMVMTKLALPLFLIWDALSMMLFGMAYYKSGVLQGRKSKQFYTRLTIAGLGAGLILNGYEVWLSYASNFDPLGSFDYIRWSYHPGRFAMASGYIGVICLMLQSGVWEALTRRLAAVGRMALTNYLTHSFVFMLVFTGAGLGLMQQFSRPQLYLFVFAMWIFQLFFSPWWLKNFTQGPFEWLWRTLTYGKMAKFKR